MPQQSDQIAVNDLLGKPPGWLLRSGITLIFFIVTGILILSAFIHYPDELTGEAIIQHEQAPIAITPRVTAPLDTLLVKDGDAVAFNQLLGVLKNESSWRQVLALDSLLSNNEFDFTPGPVFDQLGSLQGTYAERLAVQNAYHHLLTNGGVDKQVQTTSKEINYTAELITTTRKQLALLDQQINLETKDYQRQLALAKENVISERDSEEKEKAWLAAKERRVLLEASIIQYQLRADQLKQQRFNTSQAYHDQLFELQQTYEKLTKNLTGQIQVWKEQFLLRSPMEGQVIFNGHIVEKQLIQSGENLLAVQPAMAEQTPLVARINVPVGGIGKIASGDKVIIRLDAYPENEYGVIVTTLAHISALPQATQNGETLYALEAPLPKPLQTNFGKQLPLQLTRLGTGTVITKDRSVLSRIFEQLYSLINQAH